MERGLEGAGRWKVVPGGGGRQRVPAGREGSGPSKDATGAGVLEPPPRFG
jgi:hypothetical protein